MAFGFLIIFSIPVIVLIVAILLPVRLRLRGWLDQDARLRVDVHTFGGVAPAIPVFDTARKARKSPKKPKRPDGKKTAKKGRGTALRGAWQLLVDLAEQMRIAWIRGEADFGFSDPADTGMVYGALAPIVQIGKHAAHIDLVIRPDFHREGISGNIDAAVDLVPVRLVPPVLRFGWTNLRSDKWN